MNSKKISDLIVEKNLIPDCHACGPLFIGTHTRGGGDVSVGTEDVTKNDSRTKEKTLLKTILVPNKK